jgi:ABC-type multidrug transport system fused ATPase/permease subunit
MPFLFLGLVFAALFWMLWTIAWVVVWAVALLAWPIAVVVGAVLLLRAMTRGSLRFAEVRSRAGSGALRNTAFEDYRRETLHRLDEEQGKFREYLERMRKSRDKQEFDRFMAERRPRPSLPAA